MTGEISNALFTEARANFEYQDDSRHTIVRYLDADDDTISGKVRADSVTWSSDEHPLEVTLSLPNVAEALDNFARSEPLFVHVVDATDGSERTVFTRATDVYPEQVDGETVHQANIGWNIGRRREMPSTYVVEAARIVSPLDRPGRHLLDSAVEIEASVPTGSAPAMLARIVDSDGQPLDPLDIKRVLCSAFTLDERDALVSQRVPGHEEIILDSRDMLLSGLVNDPLWGETDQAGYNLLFRPDTTADPLLPQQGRFYRVVLKLVPWSGPVLPIHFRLRTV